MTEMAAAVKTFKSERAKAGAGPENSGCLLFRVRCEYPAVIISAGCWRWCSPGSGAAETRRKSMFCISCGKEIEDGSLFCEHCGAKQEEAPAAEQQAPSTPAAEDKRAAAPQGAPVTQDPSVTPIGAAAAPTAVAKKPMSPKTKLILAIVVGVVVLFFVLKAILNSINDPNKTINKFIDSIRNQDTDAFLQVVTLPSTVSEEDFALTEESVAPFFAGYSGSDALSSFQNTLMEDLTYLNRGIVAPGDGFIRLVENSNFLFSSYEVEITPITATLYSEFEGTVLTMAGSEYTVGYDGVAVQLLPGFYSGSATYTSADTGVTLTTEFTDYNISSYDNYLNVEFDYVSAYIEASSSALELESIDIDGTAYAGDLSELDFYYGFSIGPVNADSEIRVVATAYGMEFEQTFSMAESTRCYFTVTLPDDVQEAAVALVTELVPTWLQVRYSYSQSALDALVSAYGETSPDFTAEWTEWLSGRLESMNANPTYYNYEELSDMTVGEVEISNISFGSDGISARAYVPVEGMVLQKGWETAGTPSDEEPNTFSGDASVYLLYTDGEWSVTRISW